MYTTYATSILQLKIKSGSKYGAENHRKLMAAPRPTFQQFVDYLLRTEVYSKVFQDCQKLSMLNDNYKHMLFKDPFVSM